MGRICEYFKLGNNGKCENYIDKNKKLKESCSYSCKYKLYIKGSCSNSCNVKEDNNKSIKK